MILTDSVNLLLQLDLEGFVSLFWYLFIFDFPRYTLSLVSVALSAFAVRSIERAHYTGPVSVLLVGHNEGHKLAYCIRSLEEQTIADRLQIVVVDDGSTDNMAKVGAALLQAGRISQFVRTGLRGGKASALNVGFAHCRHEILVVADIDTTFDRDAVERLAAWFNDPAVGAVSGNLCVRNPHDSVITAYQAIQYFASISLGRRFTSMLNMVMIVSGGFGAFRRAAIEGVGLWDVGPGDDSNLTTKVRRAGWHARFAHDAWAMTDVPRTLGGFVRQRLRWNRSIVRNRVRKFRSVFNPFQANFSINDLLGTVNILFFQVALAVGFFVYLGWILFYYPELALILIGTVNIVYMAEDLLVFGIARRLYGERVSFRLVPFLATFWFFKSYFLRALRTVAYLSELVFRHSYADPFYPAKVRRSVERF